MTKRLDRLVQELLSALESEKRRRDISPEISRALDIAYDVESELRSLSTALPSVAAVLSSSRPCRFIQMLCQQSMATAVLAHIL